MKNTCCQYSSVCGTYQLFCSNWAWNLSYLLLFLRIRSVAIYGIESVKNYYSFLLPHTLYKH